MNRIISALVIIACLLAGSTADAFSFVQKFNSSYTYTNTDVRIQLNQASISMATSVANGVSMSVITAAGATNNFYSTTSSIFSLTLWPPNGVSTSVYLYAGDKLRVTSSATNDAWLTIIYGGLDAERIHGTSNIIANTIGAAALDTNSVPSYAIQAGAVTATKLASNSVNGSSHVQDYSIVGVDIATNAIGPNQLSNTAVTAGTYTNVTITVDADGRITSAVSVPSSAVGTQGLSSVVGISADAGGGNATNLGLVQATTFVGSQNGSNIVAGSMPVSALNTNLGSLLRIIGVNSSAGTAAGVGAGGARVMMVSTTRVPRTTSIRTWSYLASSNTAVSTFANDLGITMQVSSNSTSWIDVDKGDAIQGAAAGNGYSIPGKVGYDVPAGMYYQIFCNAGTTLALHQGWTNNFQIVIGTTE